MLLFFLHKILLKIGWASDQSDRVNVGNRHSKKGVSMNKWRAQVMVKWAKDAPKMDNWDWLKEWKEVSWAGSTMGDWDLTLWVDVKGPEELESFVHKKLRAKPWVVDTHSTWVKEVWAA